MPSNYARDYKNADEKTRRPHLPGYETDENGRVKIVAGELYCRAEDEDGAMCSRDRIFSHTGNLKKHVQECHSLEYVHTAACCLSGADDRQAARFYRNLQQIATGSDIVLDTPIKSFSTRRSTTKPPIPLDRDNQPDLAAMKDIAGYAPNANCHRCTSIQRACPPPKSDHRCRVWNHFGNSFAGLSAARAHARTNQKELPANRKITQAHPPSP